MQGIQPTFAFALRYAELRRFTQKGLHNVEDDRE